MKKFVDEHITCHLPDAKDPFEAPLFNLVHKLQTHVHTSSCIRKKKGPDGKRSMAYCRFRFPRCTSRETVVEKRAADVLRDRFSRKGAGKLYVLKRSLAEQDINDYNPDILFAWKAK